MSGSHGSTIMVCGIAGVGKTHLIHAALGRLPSGLTWRASEIIGEARKTRDPERLRALPADDIRRSQELLVDGFEARRRALPDNLVLLDAHSVIDSDDGLFEIPVDI